MTQLNPMALVLATLVAAAGLAPAQQGVPSSNRAGSAPTVQQGTPRALPGTTRATTPKPKSPTPTPRPPAARPATAARVVYVKTPDAPIRAVAGGGVIATAQQGAALSVVADDKLQFRVRLADGREGVIAKRLVQDKPPSSGGLGIVVADDRRPTEMGTGASVRSLREGTAATAVREGMDEQAVASVQKMEGYTTAISDAEVAEFARQGGVQK